MKDQIRTKLVEYIIGNSITFSGTSEELPTHKSLIEMGVLDSYGIIELVEFIEAQWQMKVPDSEFNFDNFGSIDKITSYISAKNP